MQVHGVDGFEAIFLDYWLIIDVIIVSFVIMVKVIYVLDDLLFFVIVVKFLKRCWGFGYS